MPFSRSLLILTLVCGFVFGIATSSIATQKGSARFSDMRSGTYYDDAVGELNALGIINGYEDGRFGPNDFVTRGQVAVLMKRLRDELKGSGVTTESTTSSTTARSNPTTSTAPSTPSTTQTVSTSNAAGSIHFTTTSFTVDENRGSISLSLIRSGGKTGEVTVDYETSDSKATAGQDYERSSGTVRFNDNEVSKVITIPIIDDSSVEGTETLSVKLQNVKGGASLGVPATAVLNIRDDEQQSSTSSVDTTNGQFEFSALAYEVSEAGTGAIVRIRRTGGSVGSVTVRYETIDATAEHSDEYRRTSGTLTFDEGQTEKSFHVEVINNSAIGGNKNFKVRLHTPSGGAVLGLPTEVLVNILDDEISTPGHGEITFDASEISIDEDSGEAKVHIVRVGGAEGPVSVKYETDGGTATANIDYTDIDGELNFADGESKKVIIIPIKTDDHADSGETIQVKIKEPGGGATLGDRTVMTVRIE